MTASVDKAELVQKVCIRSRRLARFGLKLNVRKTEYLTTDAEASGSIQIERRPSDILEQRLRRMAT